jgi:hypothetical protein
MKVFGLPLMMPRDVAAAAMKRMTGSSFPSD